MKIVLNNENGSPNFTEALAELVEGAHTVSVAVSYIQVTGWDLFQQQTQGLNLQGMRIVCTDQLGVTHPEAVKRAIAQGVQMRNFSGDVIYHPKIILAQDQNLNPIKFLLGSANLSSSAFTNSVEGGVLGADEVSLAKLASWFDDLFDHRTEDFTPAKLLEMEDKWKRAAAWRAKNRLLVRRSTPVIAGALEPVGAEDIDAVEDVFATIQLPIGLLNFDFSGNNIRNIPHARNVLESHNFNQKQRNELKLLGLFSEGQLTLLGQAVEAAGSDQEFARIWCAWLQETSDVALMGINQKGALVKAKRVLRRFWTLRNDVREYFLANAQNPEDRRLMQTIELLCNAQDVVQELSLDDMRTLSNLLANPESIPLPIRDDVLDYFNNKGTRSWRYLDRRTMPIAWHEAANL